MGYAIFTRRVSPTVTYIRCVTWNVGQEITDTDTSYQGNVLVDEWGHVKLSDFGLSNISDAELSIGTMRPGAMRYMAPEIHDPARYGLNHIRHTEKSDVYSFGHICWKVHLLVTTVIEATMLISS